MVNELYCFVCYFFWLNDDRKCPILSIAIEQRFLRVPSPQPACWDDYLVNYPAPVNNKSEPNNATWSLNDG